MEDLGTPEKVSHTEDALQGEGQGEQMIPNKSKLKLWAKKALKQIKPGIKTRVSEDLKLASKTAGWKIRSPLSRRTPPKEDSDQAAEIENLKQGLKNYESAKSEIELLKKALKDVEAAKSAAMEEAGRAAEIEKLREALREYELANSHKHESKSVGPNEGPNVEYLRAEIKQLEEYKAAAAARLSKEKLDFQPTLKEMEARIKTLEEKERRLEPLIQVGVDIRCRAFEKYQKDKDPTAEEDLVLVKRGNNAAHYGNIAADAALFWLKAIDQTKHEKNFNTVYGIGKPENYRGHYLSAKFTDILNFRGTVELSAHYPDQSIYNKFMALEKKWRIFLSAGKNPPAKALPVFNSDPKLRKEYMNMEQLAREICNKARSYKMSGSHGKHLKQLAKGKQEEDKRQLELDAAEAKSSTEPLTAAPASTQVKPTKKKKSRKKEKTMKIKQGTTDENQGPLSENKAREVEAVVVEENKATESDEVENSTQGTEMEQPGVVIVASPSVGFFGAISDLLRYCG